MTKAKASDEAISAVVSGWGGDPAEVLLFLRPPGLGDYVHSALASIGITPERVAAALGVDDCGCERRRKSLNEFGLKMGIGTQPEGPKEGEAPIG